MVLLENIKGIYSCYMIKAENYPEIKKELKYGKRYDGSYF